MGTIDLNKVGLGNIIELAYKQKVVKGSIRNVGGFIRYQNDKGRYHSVSLPTLMYRYTKRLYNKMEK